MLFSITLVPKLPGTREKHQLGGSVRGNIPWLGCLILSRDTPPQYLKGTKLFKNTILYFNFVKVIPGYTIWQRFRFSDTLLQSRSNKFYTRKRKIWLLIQFVSSALIFVLRLIPHIMTKMPACFHSSHIPLCPVLCTNNPSHLHLFMDMSEMHQVMTSMLGNKNSTLTPLREEKIQLQLTALFSYDLCNTESFISMCQTCCKTNPSHFAHSS